MAWASMVYVEAPVCVWIPARAASRRMALTTTVWREAAVGGSESFVVEAVGLLEVAPSVVGAANAGDVAMTAIASAAAVRSFLRMSMRRGSRFHAPRRTLAAFEQGGAPDAGAVQQMLESRRRRLQARRAGA